MGRYQLRKYSHQKEHGQDKDGGNGPSTKSTPQASPSAGGRPSQLCKVGCLGVDSLHYEYLTLGSIRA